MNGFRRLWAATGLANLADGLLITALPLLALAIGAEAWEVALITTVATLAWPVFGLAAGAIVDTYPKGPLLTVVNVARMLVFATVAVLAATGHLTMPMLLAAAAVYGLCETLVDTGLVSAVPETVPVTFLTRANARIEATVNITNQLVGPPIAGLLVAVALVATPALSAVLYAGAALALGGSVLARSSPAGETVLGQVRAQRPRIRDGLGFLMRHVQQRTLTVLTAAMSIVWGAWAAVFVVYVVRPEGLGLTGFEYGLLLSSMAAGGILASIFVSRLVGLIGRSNVLFIDAIGTVLLVAPAAFGAPVWIVAAGVVIAGAGSSMWVILVATIRQQTTPGPLLGRVYAASRVVSWGAVPVGAAAAGAITAAASVQAALLAATAAAGLALAGFVAAWALGLLADPVMPSADDAVRMPD